MWPTLLEKVNDYMQQTRSVFPLTAPQVLILGAFLLVGPLFCQKLHHFKNTLCPISLPSLLNYVC